MKKTITPVILLLTMLVTFSQTLSAEPGAQRPTKEISKIVAGQIKVDGQLPAVVFSVDKKGNVQAFRVKGTTSKPFKFPLPAGSIQSMQTITLFETTNPKFCWTNANGEIECIVW